MLHNVNEYALITTFSGSTPVRRPCAGNPGENSYKRHALKSQFIGHIFELTLTVKAQFIQSRMVSSEGHSIERAVRKEHFKIFSNRTTAYFVPVLRLVA